MRKRRRRAPEMGAIEKRYHDYFAALGSFVSTYTHVETVLYFALVHYSGITHQAAKAVFSGTRMDAAAGFLRRMIEQKRIKRETERRHLEKALSQIAVISSTRNLILHYGVEHVATKRARATNQLRALNREKSRSIPVTIQDLEDMTEDLTEIAHGLYKINCGPRLLKRQKGEVAALLRAPWRYTPPPPKPRRRPQRGKSAKRQRPPQS